MWSDWIMRMAGAVAVATASTWSAAETGGRLDVAGVTTLLDVMDALADLHPGFEEKAVQLERLSEVRQASLVAEARRRNKASSRLEGKLDGMLATETSRSTSGVSGT
jgi:hypothetical protein